MPTFKDVLSDKQIWQLALFVANADKLPDSAKNLLLPGPTPPTVIYMPAPTTKN
jgi:hypothetical protein